MCSAADCWLDNPRLKRKGNIFSHIERVKWKLRFAKDFCAHGVDAFAHDVGNDQVVDWDDYLWTDFFRFIDCLEKGHPWAGDREGKDSALLIEGERIARVEDDIVDEECEMWRGEYGEGTVRGVERLDGKRTMSDCLAGLDNCTWDALLFEKIVEVMMGVDSSSFVCCEDFEGFGVEVIEVLVSEEDDVDGREVLWHEVCVGERKRAGVDKEFCIVECNEKAGVEELLNF